MTVGVGGSTPEQELVRLSSLRGDVPAITVAERQQRIARAATLLDEKGYDALWLDASTSLLYFTGLRERPTERLHGAILTSKGELTYICPTFEREKLQDALSVPGDIRTWQEHEDPTALVIASVQDLTSSSGTLAVDEATRFFTFDGFRKAGNAFDFVNGNEITAACRMIKSTAEIDLMRTAMQLTVEAQQSAARIMEEGITDAEVKQFLVDVHKTLGAEGPPGFNIVLFGEASAYPHGVSYAQSLKEGDMVLIDVGAPIDGYMSDITRSYVFGEPTDRQRFVWNVQKEAQAAAFEAAQIGAPCEAVDAAARKVIADAGFGPGYETPGLPHRTGHGIGLDVHEWAYLVQGDTTELAPGMCFSNEPTICIYGEFGVRLEDHFYMTEDGPRWFTEPAHSVDDPFGPSDH